MNNYYRTLGQTPTISIPGAPGVQAPIKPTPLTPLEQAQKATDELIAVLDQLEPGWQNLYPGADTIDSLNMSDFENTWRGTMTPQPSLTINVTGTGDLTDSTKKAVVNAVVEASGAGFNTGWFRTTGFAIV